MRRKQKCTVVNTPINVVPAWTAITQHLVESSAQILFHGISTARRKRNGADCCAALRKLTGAQEQPPNGRRDRITESYINV